VTISGSQQANGSHCVEVSRVGAGGATLDSTYYGEFQVVDDGILSSSILTAAARNPHRWCLRIPPKKIGPGVFEYIQVGYSYDEGTAKFGRERWLLTSARYVTPGLIFL